MSLISPNISSVSAQRLEAGTGEDDKESIEKGGEGATEGREGKTESSRSVSVV